MSSLGKRKKAGSSQTQQSKAYWANKKFNSKYTWDVAGAARLKRGSDFTRDRYGLSWAVADGIQKTNRKADAWTGAGKYSRLMKGLVKAGKKAKVGQLAMNAAQRYAGSGLYGRYSGRGLYTDNVTIDGGMPGMSVSAGATDNQEITVTHCEYLQDVFCPNSSNFENQSIDLNPGIAENMPWLSQIAANYEEYEFIQCVFSYRSTIDPSASNNSTGATGTLIMATNYNPDAPEFTTKEAMMQYHGAISGRLTDGLTHGVECDPSKNAGTATKYTRSFALTGDTSKKDFDLGKFQFAVVNAPSAFYNQQIGELWCSYTVRLQKPRLNVALYRNLPMDRWVTQSNGGIDSQGDFVEGVGVGLNVQFQNTQYGKLGVNEQNSLGIQVDWQTAIDSSLAPVGLNAYGYSGYADCRLRFPDFLTGSFMVKIYVYASDIALNNTGLYTAAYSLESQQAMPSGIAFHGNVKGCNVLGPALIPDGSQTGTPPGPYASYFTYISDFINGKSFLEITACLTVSPATAGVDNVFEFAIFNAQAATNVRASQIVLTPINDSLSDKFNFNDGTTLDIPAVKGTPNLWPQLTGNGN